MLRATITNVVDNRLTPESTVEVDGRTVAIPERGVSAMFWHRVAAALVGLGYRMPFGSPDHVRNDGSTYTVDVVPINEED